MNDMSFLFGVVYFCAFIQLQQQRRYSATATVLSSNLSYAMSSTKVVVLCERKKLNWEKILGCKMDIFVNMLLRPDKAPEKCLNISDGLQCRSEAGILSPLTTYSIFSPCPWCRAASLSFHCILWNSADSWWIVKWQVSFLGEEKKRTLWVLLVQSWRFSSSRLSALFPKREKERKRKLIENSQV